MRNKAVLERTTEVPAEATAFGMRRPHFATLIYGA
jgi:hypothetical protein